MNTLNGIKITADKEGVLTKLKANRDKHRQIVAEARVGYVKRAQQELEKNLGLLKEGKLKQVHIFLEAPVDYTEVYDTVITMLEMDQSNSVTLDSKQVRNLVMDQWDWKSQFLALNSAYSSTAQAESAGAAWPDLDE